jgi:hypothetical protein
VVLSCSNDLQTYMYQRSYLRVYIVLIYIASYAKRDPTLLVSVQIIIDDTGCTQIRVLFVYEGVLSKILELKRKHIITLTYY